MHRSAEQSHEQSHLGGGEQRGEVARLLRHLGHAQAADRHDAGGGDAGGGAGDQGCVLGQGSGDVSNLVGVHARDERAVLRAGGGGSGLVWLLVLLEELGADAGDVGLVLGACSRHQGGVLSVHPRDEGGLVGVQVVGGGGGRGDLGGGAAQREGGAEQQSNGGAHCV